MINNVFHPVWRRCLLAISAHFFIGVISATEPFAKIVNETSSEDHLVVVKNHKITFDIKELELISDEIIFLQKPEFGTVADIENGAMSYIPKADICEEKDHFSYVLKTSQGFDTINVTIDIICETLTVLSGFSPDGDGVNDNFTILGIQNYPNNSLLIFNKWGETIFQQKGYENNWNGHKMNGDSASSDDNVYYYVLNDGEGQLYSGYLQIKENI